MLQTIEILLASIHSYNIQIGCGQSKIRLQSSWSSLSAYRMKLEVQLLLLLLLLLPPPPPPPPILPPPLLLLLLLLISLLLLLQLHHHHHHHYYFYYHQYYYYPHHRRHYYYHHHHHYYYYYYYNHSTSSNNNNNNNNNTLRQPDVGSWLLFSGFEPCDVLRGEVISLSPNPKPGGPGLHINDPRRQGGRRVARERHFPYSEQL